MNLRNNNFNDKFLQEKMFTTILHEMHHGLGFVSNLLDRFYDRAKKKTRIWSEVYESSTDYQVRMRRP
jgi:hypothetical protein